MTPSQTASSSETHEYRERSQKQTFLSIFFILTLALMAMPFLTTFNDVLTRLIMKFDAYRVIEDVVVPAEVRMVGVILLPLGLQPAILGEYLALQGKDGLPFLIEIVWNCVGWQSLLFFLLTGWIGLQGDRYTRGSKLKAWLIGLLGTFLVNLFRIAFVALVAYFFGQFPAILFHDYGSTLFVILWLFAYWWFAYAYVLEPKSRDEAGRGQGRGWFKRLSGRSSN